MTDLIRWTELPQGGFAGYAGDNPACLLEIYPPDPPGSAWVLQSFLPGQAHAEHPGTGAGELMERAEELLREFASSIWVVFPDHPGGLLWRDSERRKIQAAATANARNDCIALLRDKADEAGRQGAVIRAQVYGASADLIEGDDQ